ncbi:putative disease resistance RPP13-like protein 1 [Senna tora]|uniref:Putative disease resistance RPP13-like protein 1 n=1 Tax=Senna tora TaxID=362788 RepID=A0A834TNC3_9FABA|nr:putative disease resistance RPP13-like protein 1 [Senna tora]
MAAAFAGGVIFAACVQVSVEKLASRRTLEFFKKRGFSKELLNKFNIKLYSPLNTTIPNANVVDGDVTDSIDDDDEYVLVDFDYDEESRENVEPQFHLTSAAKEQFESEINSIIEDKLEEVERRIGEEIEQDKEKIQRELEELRAQIQQLCATNWEDQSISTRKDE